MEQTNNAFERTAGSHALAEAAQRERTEDHPYGIVLEE